LFRHVVFFPFNKIDVSKVIFDELKDNERVEDQKIGYIKYKGDDGEKQLYIQSPEITIDNYGFNFNEKHENNDLKVPLEVNEIRHLINETDDDRKNRSDILKSFTNVLEEIDSIPINNLESLFGKKNAKNYKYTTPMCKKQAEDDEEEIEEKKKQKKKEKRNEQKRNIETEGKRKKDKEVKTKLEEQKKKLEKQKQEFKEIKQELKTKRKQIKDENTQKEEEKMRIQEEEKTIHEEEKQNQKEEEKRKQEEGKRKQEEEQKRREEKV
jgi:hypothetical protein